MQPDPYGRTRHGSQAYPVTSFGKALETAKSGYGKRLTGTPMCAITFTLDAGSTDTVALGDLTAGFVPHSVINHVGLGTGTLTLTVEESSDGAADDFELATALDLLTAAETAVPAGTSIPLPTDRVLTAAIAAGTGGETATITILGFPIAGDWA